ncbi:MAG: DUF4317 domain-containing protein [Clostridia bacterium]|nr:DUF4317 domain-containing protein [Clostridia bacterium]
MNEKELAELRRRYRHDKSNITHVRGCFVNEKKEIISEFEQSLGMISEDDADDILSLMRKSLSGVIGRNLLEIEFSTAQVMESEEHKLLSVLRATKCADADSRRALFEKIAGSLEHDGSYVILLAHERYDVPAHGADGEEKPSESVFSYIHCAICPIKASRPVLSYYFPGNCMRSITADCSLSSPLLGFTFPAFENGGANIYKAMYYAKDLKNNHKELSEALFASEIPMPAAEQKATFGAILETAMAEDCSLRVVRAVHTQMCQLIEAYKEEPTEEPLKVTKDDAAEMLRVCSVPEERVTLFEEKFTEAFGENAEIHPKTVAESKRLKVKTPEVSITVAEGCGERLETRVIDGVRYLLIRADGDVEVNGVNIQM